MAQGKERDSIFTSPGLTKKKLADQLELLNASGFMQRLIDSDKRRPPGGLSAEQMLMVRSRTLEVTISLLRCLQAEEEISPLSRAELATMAYTFISHVLASTTGVDGAMAIYTALAQLEEERHIVMIRKSLEDK